MLLADQDGVVTLPFGDFTNGGNRINVDTYQPSALALRAPVPRSGMPELADPDPRIPPWDAALEAEVEALLPSLPRGSAREDLRTHEEKRNELRQKLRDDAKARGGTTTTGR